MSSGRSHPPGRSRRGRSINPDESARLYKKRLLRVIQSSVRSRQPATVLDSSIFLDTTPCRSGNRVPSKRSSRSGCGSTSRSMACDISWRSSLLAFATSEAMSAWGRSQPRPRRGTTCVTAPSHHTAVAKVSRDRRASSVLWRQIISCCKDCKISG